MLIRSTKLLINSTKQLINSTTDQVASPRLLGDQRQLGSLPSQLGDKRQLGSLPSQLGDQRQHAKKRRAACQKAALFLFAIKYLITNKNKKTLYYCIFKQIFYFYLYANN